MLIQYTANGTAKTKNCKVTGWHMDPLKGKGEIRFTIPRLPADTYPLKVINSIGISTGELTIN